MLRIGRGVDRDAIRRALLRRGGAATVVYDDVLRVRDIREAMAGIRAAGTPGQALPLLAWLASHPNTPLDILRTLGRHESREVLLSLAMNRKLPADLRRRLLRHPDEDVREHASQSARRARPADAGRRRPS
jgi:hypothetical protein